jgi:hypothetical protein
MFSRTETTAERMIREPAMPSRQPSVKDDLGNAGAEHRHHHQQDDEIGKTHPGIDEALHDQVELAAEIAGEDSDRDGHDRRQGRGGEGDDHGNLRAVKAARQHVPAEIIGAEPVRPRRRHQPGAR